MFECFVLFSIFLGEFTVSFEFLVLSFRTFSSVFPQNQKLQMVTNSLKTLLLTFQTFELLLNV